MESVLVLVLDSCLNWFAALLLALTLRRSQCSKQPSRVSSCALFDRGPVVFLDSWKKFDQDRFFPLCGHIGDWKDDSMVIGLVLFVAFEYFDSGSHCISLAKRAVIPYDSLVDRSLEHRTGYRQSSWKGGKRFKNEEL